MVPPPLWLSDSSGHRYSHSFASSAISSAASPSRNSFQLSYRSPLTPRNFDDEIVKNTVPITYSGEHLAAPKSSSSIVDDAESRVVYSRDGSTAEHENDSSSSTVFSPTDRTWFLTPSTPSILRDEVLQSEEGSLGVVSVINIIVGKTLGVGAYTVPSAIFEGVGSVGMSLLLWVIGSIISFCGLAVYLDLGTAIPKSGGERVYLERIFRRPRMLATCMFMSYVVLLGFSTPNAIVLGDYVLYALDHPRSRWDVRAIAVLVVSALCYIHARFPRLGLRLINVLSVAKLLILFIVVLCGVAGASMGVGRPDNVLHPRRLDFHDRPLSTAQRNFSGIWGGSSMQPYDYATALLKVIYCFRGYNAVNQVLSDVRDPVRTVKIAAPIALGIISVAYLTINVAFFLAVDKEDFKASGVVVAGTFFRNIFGDAVGGHVLPLFVIISAAGNIAATSFAQARVNEELAKDGLLPWSDFWTPRTTITSGSPDSQVKTMGLPAVSNTPSRGLLLHWVVSVVVIVVPPPGKIYNFLIDIGGYPVSVISVAVSLGLLYLHMSPSERWSSPFPANRIAIVVFATFNCLLLIFPWIPPMDGKGEDSGYAYYAYPATALSILGSGALYWCWWRTRGNGRSGHSGGGL